MTDQPSPYSQAADAAVIAHRDARIRELEAALAAATRERNEARADWRCLSDGLAAALEMDPDHPMPMAMLASVRALAVACKAAEGERDELREAARAMVKSSGEAPFRWCGRCEEMATRVTTIGVARCDGCATPMGASAKDLDYALAWRRLVALTKETP